ncbi:hypothetical protein [Corynebacterium glyciniphilum]|uniref:hypothetical protein n=1 Tax=Corynebacterium glyciniphilum TaxID=1404244 RepID=UPI00264B57F8|nr:hypothetical protein [Corynebacterium glyciniphilum]MDN6706368.1 hypothetical protein [Corynebacterium glyciniphilum]
MTILTGKIRPAAGLPTNGTLIAWSPRFRPGSDSAITEERTQAPIVDGEFKIEVEPGEVTFNFVGLAGETSTLESTVPSVDELDILDLMEGDFEYQPPVVQAAQQAARDARADRVESQRIATTFGGIERVDDLEKSAKTSAKSAEDHRKASKASEEEANRQATRSEQEADRSAGQARASADSAGDASASAVAAAESEDEAGKSQVASAGHEEAARGYSVTAGEHATAADGHRKAAATSEENAATSEDNAEAAATRSEESATTADQTVRDAVTEVTAVTEGHKVAAEAAAGSARSSATEGRGYRDAAREAAAQAEDIATGDLPSASESTRGLIQMTGDLAGSGDDPRVPALSLAAPGASVQVVPPGLGWGNAVADAATTPTGWDFDGEWLTPPLWLDRVTVTVDWCGGSSLVLRGRRSDDTVSTIVTLPEGTPETHRSTTVVVPLAQFEAVAVAATWTQEDLDAVCTASLVVQVLPAHEHTRADLPWWDEVMSQYVRGNDERLSDPRYPTEHEHEIGEVRGLQAVLDRLDALEALVRGRPALWPWDGVEPWTPSEHALPVDQVWDTDGGDVHSVEEVIGDE